MKLFPAVHQGLGPPSQISTPGGRRCRSADALSACRSPRYADPRMPVTDAGLRLAKTTAATREGGFCTGRPSFQWGALRACHHLIRALAIAATLCAWRGRAPIFAMSAAKASVLRRTASPPQSLAALTQRIVSISARYRGTPYRRDPLGEGPAGTIDRDPLICTTGVDCQTYVEQVDAGGTDERVAIDGACG